ncbi:low-density lipoprotein receptor-like protein 4 [Sarcoptes scabiei]|uniref:Low-density lipoprotein receptor-like protein 4 n=1 Tax=Sarcoptes scabiei TaxID=52283 RepID=A0A132AAW0_SARSC|nr:low-density lipoprotein receptor-like protein 4 [Sarcoptes scabiei]
MIASIKLMSFFAKIISVLLDIFDAKMDNVSSNDIVATDFVIVSMAQMSLSANNCSNDRWFQCRDGQCISKELRCNFQKDCFDGTDEINCQRICQQGQYTCANGRCIEMIHRCDGHQDCLDYSDEQDCPSTNISLQIQPERQTVRQGQEAVFRCRDEGDLRVPVRWVREGNRPLPPESIDNRGRLILFNVQINYSGVYICKADINIDVNVN